jgi:hypothetical protein
LNRSLTGPLIQYNLKEKRMDRKQAAIFCMVLSALMVIAAFAIPSKHIIIAWIVVGLLLVGFILCLGAAISKNPLGILINEQNLMSLSRFQTTLWTIIILSALLVIAVARIRDGAQGEPLNIQIGGQLLTLLGITMTSLVGSPLIDATKKSKTPDQNAAFQTATALVQTQNTPASASTVPALQAAIAQHAQGVLYKNPSLFDASFFDMFEGAEVGNAAQVDLSKVQMFIFTIVVACAYIFALAYAMRAAGINDASFSFPVLSDGMVALLGLSNGGYLGNKAVDHTKT